MASNMSALNPDRATLNFLNSFPEAVRKRGEHLQEEGAVTQIFGNHLFIQGRVEDKSGVHRTTLRLQGNRWFGSCSTEDDETAGAVMFAAMLERLHRGEDLPESPNEFDDTPIVDLIEEKLDRELDDKEAEFVSKVEKRYRRYVIEGEIHDHDMVRLNPRWEIASYEPLELWPVPPGDILEFWNYLAYAFYKKKLPYADFMECITDLEGVQRRMHDWEQEREVAAWYDRIESVNDRPPQEIPHKIEFRLLSTINEARVEAREEGEEEWTSLREKGEIERILKLFDAAALRMDAASRILWEHFLRFSEKSGETYLDLEQEESCRFMNLLFHQKELAGYLVNLDERPFKVVDEKLSWICDDDAMDPNSFALQLVTKSGDFVSHSVRLLPGRTELYQSDETVFPGPPRWLEDTEIMPRYSIPKSVIDSLEGVEFLRKIGSSLPPSMKRRVTDLDLFPHFKLWVEQGLTAAETEHLVVDVKAFEAKGRREEKLIKAGWDLIDQKPVKGKALLRFAREKLYPVPSLLLEMGLTYDEKLEAFKGRITKQFPEKFAEWIESMPDYLELDIEQKLKTILADPVTAAIRFEVVNQEIDWFDLRVVIDVEGVNLSKAQIRQLVAARGGYVRMDDGSWMRLEIKLDPDQRDAVTRLGLDPFDLSGETHRMHAMQLADPKAAEVFDPKAWKRIKDRARDIQIDIKPDVPGELNAKLRPYQVEGFQFLAYLSTNGFGGILADDMGLGKTIQSITYILWLRKNAESDEKMKRLGPALVVCPKSVLDVWATEAGKFAPELKVKVLRTRDDLDLREVREELDILVLNYAQLRVCGEELNKIRWLTVILDEGQQIKNPDSKAAKCARELDAENRLVLTGTPIENRLMDMWSLMAFAMPGVLGTRAYFKRRFDKRKDPSSQNRLAARLRPFLLRRTKGQVAKDLPPRTEEEVFAGMDGIQEELYKAELKRIQKALLGLDSDEAVKKNSFAILQGLMRLRQICCHPGLIDPKWLKEESAKMNALFYLLDQLREENHKVLVFSQFVSMLDIIKTRLEVESRPFNYLTGQTKDRKGEIEKFQTTKDPSVFLLSLKAGGAGLNLTSASYVILYDPWWNPAVENQAIDRTHRIGQKNKVIAYRLLTRDSVEEKIRILQHQKTALVTNILGDEGFASNLGMEDLQFILSHGGGDDEDMTPPPPKPPVAKKAAVKKVTTVTKVAKKAAKKATKKAAKKNPKK